MRTETDVQRVFAEAQSAGVPMDDATMVEYHAAALREGVRTGRHNTGVEDAFRCAKSVGVDGRTLSRCRDAESR